MTETTSKKNPFDFLFFYEFDGELEKDALLVGDDPSTASPLHLDICINKKEAIQKIVIRPIPGVTEASSSNYHLKLDFNAGILLQPEQITVEGDDWALKGVEEDRSSSFYLLWKGEEVTLNDAAKPLKLTLNGVMGTLDSLVTTSRTTVTLSWEFKRRGITIIDVTPMTSAAPDDDFGPYYNNATETLKMIQRQGKPNIPLYVGFFSSNRVLNTDSQHSTLKLRITNRSESCITFNYDTDATNRSQLIVALEVEEVGEDAVKVPWALGREDQLTKVVVSIPQPPDKWEISRPEKTGSTLEWTISPKSAKVELDAQETVVVELSNIVTDHQTGTANLYLRYKYVPGYQDGEFICPIEKAPLVFPEKNVGIGTTSPSQKFEVVGYESSEQLVSVRGNSHVSLELRSTGEGEVYYELADSNNEKKNDEEIEKFSWKIGTNADGLLHFGYGKVGGFNKPETMTILQEKMTILTDGNVGIGTKSPLGKFHVEGGKAVFLGGCNVGIGTQNPLTKLHIVGSASIPGNSPETSRGSGSILIENDGEADIVYLSGTVDNFKTWQAGANSDGWYVYDKNYRLFVQNGGNVGIGTAAPEAKLHVNDGGAKISGDANIGGDAKISGQANITGNTTISGNLNFGSSTRQMLNLFRDVHGIGVQANTTYFRSGSNFAWFRKGSHNDAECNPGASGRLQMTLGTDNQLTVFAGINCHGWLDIYDGNGLIFNQSGNSQQWKIVPEWSDPTDPDLVFYYNGKEMGWLDPADGWNGKSDERLKEDIEPVSNVLDKLMKLQPSSYYWRNSNTKSKKSFGFVAQNVETVFPQFVKEKSGFKGLNYDNFTVIAIAAIQEQQQLIASMQEEINNLKTQLQQ